MKPILFLFVTMSSLAVQAQQPATCLQLSKVEVRQHVLHQSGAADAKLTFAANHCYVFVGSSAYDPEQPVFGVQKEPGLDARVEMTATSRFDQATVRAGILRAQEVSIVLTLTASPDLILGEHHLPGSVRYKAMDGLGNISEQTLAFTFPFKVVAPERMNLPEPPFSERHPIWAKILLPLEVIALVPLYILASLMGWDGC